MTDTTPEPTPEPSWEGRYIDHLNLTQFAYRTNPEARDRADAWYWRAGELITELVEHLGYHPSEAPVIRIDRGRITVERTTDVFELASALPEAYAHHTFNQQERRP